MKKILPSFLVIILALHLQTLNSQEKDLKELFLAAESYFLFEEFNEALPLYLRVHRNYPENDNINYKIGVCYLNDPYQKNKSIRYLEEAVKNINPKYRENNFKEEGAPLDALFYLGNAYRVNNQLDKAKEYYNLFLTRLDPEIYDSQLVKEQIAACKAAEKMMKKPIDFDAENLTNRINTRFADENPVISGDETKMAFVSKLQFYDAVFYTEKIDGEWTPPRNIVPELGVDGDVYPTCLSYNGTEMFVYRNDDFIGNLYYSQLVNGKWTPIQKLNDNINTKYWESHASISKDGKTLYFSSNRKGGFGGLDIYRSVRQKNGEWGPAINLGPKVNTKYNDDTPFISDTDDKLFFSSYGHYNMGGYDIFMTMKVDSGIWSDPANIGYPINTTDDDQFFNPVRGGQAAYYSKYDLKSGFGKSDIFRFEIYSPDNPRMFSIEGFLDYQGAETSREEVDITVITRNTADTVNFLHPDEEGNFQFKVPRGNYDVVFDGEKFKRNILQLDVTPDTPHSGIVLSTPVILSLLPDKEKDTELALEDLLRLREDSIIYAFEGEDVKIRFNAEKGSTVVIDVFNDSVLVQSDTMEINRRRQTYEFQPRKGTNDVTLKLTDEEGNQVSKGLKVLVPVVAPPEIGEDENAMAEDETSAELRSSDTDIQRKIYLLEDNASGALKDYLQNLDPVAEKIKDDESLIQHLITVADGAAFTTSELDSLFIDSGYLSKIDLFILELASVSAPELEKYLRNFEASNFGIQTEDQLIGHLYQTAEKEEYTSKDVTDALAKLRGPQNIDTLIPSLSDNAGGELKDYLSDLDHRALEITDLIELMEHLINSAGENGYEVKDVLNLFESYFADDPDYFLRLFRQLKENAAGDTRKFLDGIDESGIKDLKRQEFYGLLFERSEQEKLDPEELIGLSLKYDHIYPPYLRKYLEKYGSESLSEGMETIPSEIKTPADIFKYLLDIPGADVTFKDEVKELHKDYLSNKDIYELYFNMLENSDGKLKNFLEEIDSKAMNFESPGDFINYLFDQAEKEGYSILDLLDALNKNLSLKHIQQIIRDLIEIAENGLKQALMDLYPQQENIHSLGDIVNYLLERTEHYDYTETEVYELIEKYLYGIDKEDLEDHLKDEAQDKEGKFNRGVKLTAGILLLEGLLILILIILARRKKKKKEESH